MEKHKNPEVKEAFDYLTEVRGLSEDTIRKFCLGYVPRCVTNEFGDTHEVAGRIIIPIFNQYGQLIALSSRDWRKDAFRKFWHESYPKSLYLFGLDIAKEYIIKYDLCIIVEGEFDVMTLHDKGLNCAVGAVGTALQLYQISLLKRYCSDIYFVFDGDLAGLHALKRAMKLVSQYNLRGCDINVVPVYLSKDDDPDSIVFEHGRAAFVNILKKAKEEAKERNLYDR